MPTVEFGDTPADMRLTQEAYGIPALQDFNAFVANFVPVREEIVSISPFSAVLRQYDAQGLFVTISLFGDLARGQVSSFAVEAVGVRETVFGNFTATAAGEFYGTGTGLQVNLIQDNSLLVRFTGFNVPVNSGLPELPPDSTLLAGADTITAGGGNQYLLGYGGDDSLWGWYGDDTLDGGPGADVMAGCGGNDVYFVESDGDRISESGDDGIDEVRATVSLTLPINVENLVLSGSSSISGTGNDLGNRITGNDGANALLGLGGDDVLDGGQGNDRLDGGNGADVLWGGSGDDTLIGGPPGWDFARLAPGDRLSISADGRFVAFDTFVSLSEEDPGLDYDVFVADLNESNVRRISLLPGGVEPIHGSSDPSISGAGRFVAFVGGGWSGSNTWPQIIVKDLESDEFVIASSSATGEVDYAVSGDPVMSADGRCVAFVSYSAILTPGDTNGATDVFVKDLQTGAIELVSRAVAPANGRSSDPSISADGRYVGFLSEATNLVASPPTDYAGYYVKDRVTGTLMLAFESNGVSLGAPTLSGDGRHVAWTNGMTGDVFVKDLDSGTVASAWADPSGAPAGGSALSLSHDGRYVAFATRSQRQPELELDGGPSDHPCGRFDVLVRDLLTGAITVATEPSGRTGVTLDADATALSADGSTVAMRVGYPEGTWIAAAFAASVGSDVLHGGDGNDAYLLQAYDEIVEFPGAGIDAVTTTLPAYALGPDIERLVYAGDGDFAATGNDLDNTLIGLAGNDTLNGASGNDVLDGGLGIDLAIYSTTRAGATFSTTAMGRTVSSAFDGTDTLASIERLRFADISVALDLDGNAGTVAKTLGAVFGEAEVANEVYAGIGLYLLDAGMSFENLMQLAIDAHLGVGASHQAVVDLLYTNVVGTPPPADEAAFFVALLDTHAFTVSGLGVYAADFPLNLTNIDLVGLAQQGLEYAPYAEG